MSQAIDLLGKLFKKWSGSDARTILPLPQSGSSREYYRISIENKSVVGVYHTDRKENEAFIAFDRHFRKIGIPVPKVYADELDKNVYLQQDLGDTMLFDLTERSGDFEARELMLSSLEKSVFWLPRLQVAGHKNLDYDKATPRKAFDKQSMMWDLNYFKYHFLKLTGITFDEQQLEYDFNTLVEYLDQASRNYFLYRDFQSRNIMVDKGEVWFIDFQGGRQGYPAYDLASLLFDAKAGFTPDMRDKLFEQYLRNLRRYSNIDENDFRSYYPAFVLIRKLQAMGAFGFRGLIERKAHFLQSIPPAIDNLDWITKNYSLEIKIPELWEIFEKLPGSAFVEKVEDQLKDLN